jgi:arylsulfatase A-like enzyme
MRYWQLLVLAGATCFISTLSTADDRPNLLVLVSDDQRWDTLGVAGNGIIHTPALDELANEGTRFENAFATTSICAVSRASIFTGMYARSHGVRDFGTPLPDDLFAASYPALLRAAGYATGFVGKWGLGGEMPVDAFDYFTGFGGQGQYFNEIDGETVHMTELLTRQALAFLETRAANQPFCLSVSYKAPHVQDNHPLQFLYDPKYEALYADEIIPPPATATEELFRELPGYVRHSEGRVRWFKRFATPELAQRSYRGYYRLITGIDESVGRMLDTLEKRGLRDNTVVLYTSDNGFFLGERGLAGKWLAYEPSIRVPLIVADPRMPAAARAPVREEMALLLDVAPTLLNLAGVAAPANVQGESLVPLLARATRTVPRAHSQTRPVTRLQPPRRDVATVPDSAFRWRTEFFYEHHFGNERPHPIPAVEGVRTERWKYFRYLDREPLHEELYDLHTDPNETRNLAKVPEFAGVRDEMRGRWVNWREELPGVGGGATVYEIVTSSGCH